MKLAEALVIRADQKRRIQDLRQRLSRNAKVQEGEQSAEDPNALLTELHGVVDEFTNLVQRINRTNSATTLSQGLTMADSLALRDALKIKHAVHRDLAQAATVVQDRSLKSEIKFKSAIKVTDVQRRADDFAKEHRELDAKIQEVNWQTELVD
jgi:hypothetical protein